MRRLSGRPEISQKLRLRLAREQAQVSASADVEAARRRYRAVRRTGWFSPVVDALKSLAGPGNSCHWCSANESSHVEHYRPVAKYPDLTFVYENYLWSCAICNGFKLESFDEDVRFINPIDEDPWDYFFFDRFGFLIERADVPTDAQKRAAQTIKGIHLDRDPLVKRRRSAINSLVAQVKVRIAAGEEWAVDGPWVASMIENEPIQPDVVAFFLAGFGRPDLERWVAG